MWGAIAFFLIGIFVLWRKWGKCGKFLLWEVFLIGSSIIENTVSYREKESGLSEYIVKLNGLSKNNLNLVRIIEKYGTFQGKVTLQYQNGECVECMTLFRKSKIASDGINETKRTKDQI
jgi:hypothetical protein